VQTEAVKAASQAVQIALNEYNAGTQNFTTVVTAEATELSDRESALTSQAQRLTDVITLVVALGGGWSTDELPALPTLTTAALTSTPTPIPTPAPAP
jgi:outer membrane protein TolC